MRDHEKTVVMSAVMLLTTAIRIKNLTTPFLGQFFIGIQVAVEQEFLSPGKK